jgi:hypothetical protein
MSVTSGYVWIYKGSNSCAGKQFTKRKTNLEMATIPYSFHWVRITLDTEKARAANSEATSMATTATNFMEAKRPSSLWFRQVFKSQRTDDKLSYLSPSSFDFAMLHSII